MHFQDIVFNFGRRWMPKTAEADLILVKNRVMVKDPPNVESTKSFILPTIC